MVTARSPEAAEPAVRRRCIAAATQLFAAHGFDGTSVQAIADAIGVTKQAVLHHFASKEALREAVLAAMLDHWRDTLPRLLIHILSLVMTAAAGAHVSAVALAPGAAGRTRYHSELARIAKASLFRAPEPSAPLPTHPAPRRAAPARKRPTR